MRGLVPAVFVIGMVAMGVLVGVTAREGGHDLREARLGRLSRPAGTSRGPTARPWGVRERDGPHRSYDR